MATNGNGTSKLIWIILTLLFSIGTTALWVTYDATQKRIDRLEERISRIESTWISNP